MVLLSPLTRQRVAALFPPHEIQQAETWLASECAENLPLLGDPVTPEGLERLRFAAIRVSGGRLDRLRRAIEVAKSDWRDLLVAAGFGHDVRAHEGWRPRRLDSGEVNRWMAGDLPAEVAFRFRDAVELQFGPRRGSKGVVIRLAGFEPEPHYLVELESGVEVEEYQRALKRAG